MRAVQCTAHSPPAVSVVRDDECGVKAPEDSPAKVVLEL